MVSVNSLIQWTWRHLGSAKGLSTETAVPHQTPSDTAGVAWTGWMCLVKVRSCSPAHSHKLSSLSWWWQNCISATVQQRIAVTSSSSSNTWIVLFYNLQLTITDNHPSPCFLVSALTFCQTSTPTSVLPVPSSNTFPRCSNTRYLCRIKHFRGQS